MTDQTPSHDASSPSKGPNCWECRYLAITWDMRLPYGCKLMGFRSRVIPSLEVLRTDGRFCGGFLPKAPQASAGANVKPPVGNSAQRRENDRRGPVFHINITT